jgi:putative two-component system response regulator
MTESNMTDDSLALSTSTKAIGTERPFSTQRLLVVDDDKAITSFYSRLFAGHGYAVDVAHDGPSAFAVAATAPPDAIILDVALPGCNGLDVCRRLKRESATRLTPIVLLTGMAGREQRLEGLEAGADEFLAKPADTQELVARVRSLVRVKQYTDDLDSAASIIETLAVMIEARDGHTEGHCHRMANHATALGRRLGLGSEDLRTLHRGGFLHDIGMLAIPDAILRKTGRLEPEEYELIKSHTIVGESLCGNFRSLQAVRPIVRYHHERLDGSGYPDGLKGDAIPLLAQIVGIVDAFDAITTNRPYHAAATAAEAIAVLKEQVARGWRQRNLVDEFAALVDDDYVPPTLSMTSVHHDRR